MGALAIVVPVYNGVEDIARCLASLARWRPAGASIVLVDDASSDPRIAPALAAFALSHPEARVVTCEANRGFVAAANRGAAEADPAADLLFLNSDTELTPGALEEMRVALDLRPGAAVCCPLSNNATFLSIPRYQQANELPTGLDSQGMALAVRESAGELRVLDIPTPVGFCMLVRREAWRAWGPFDMAYGSGYGEEDDFGQRVQAAGAAIVCAPRAFVYHRGGASFGASEAVAERRRVNGRLLMSRWPQYAPRTRDFCQSNPLRPLQERLWHALLSAPAKREAHVMHLVHRWEVSGALRTRVLGLARATSELANHTVLVPMPDHGAWLDAIDHEVEPGIRVVGLVRFEERFAKFLAASPAGLVHIHADELWTPPSVADIARAAGRSVLVTAGEELDVERCAQAYRASALR
jgi:GT2 family glycosyltransferase